MKYKNENFPYDYDDEKLNKHTQECMREGLGNKIESIVFSIRGQLGLAEIHKRQNDKTNRNTMLVAIAAIFLSVVSVFVQLYTSRQPMTIQSKDVETIKTHIDNNNVSQKADSIIFYLNAILKNQTLNNKCKGTQTVTALNKKNTADSNVKK